MILVIRYQISNSIQFLKAVIDRSSYGIRDVLSYGIRDVKSNKLNYLVSIKIKCINV